MALKYIDNKIIMKKECVIMKLVEGKWISVKETVTPEKLKDLLNKINEDIRKNLKPEDLSTYDRSLINKIWNI